MNLSELKQDIDIRLDEIMPSEGVLSEAMRYALFPGGKRFRPILLMLSSKIYIKETDPVLDTAAAIEMIHTFSLIHDDLPCMDNEKIRRGRDALHVRYGEGLALIAGDALFNQAFHTISSSPDISSEHKVELITEITGSLGVKGVAGGQASEISISPNDSDLSKIEKIYQGKTGSLMATSLACGGILGGSSKKELKILKEFGIRLGIAFQILDDICEVVRGELHPEEPNMANIFSVKEASEHFKRNISLSLASLGELDKNTSSLEEFVLYLKETLPDY